MARRKYALDYVDAIKLLAASGLSHSTSVDVRGSDIERMTSIDERVNSIVGVASNVKNNAGYMIFFVMYDIENNKVRRYIVKYLEKKGCIRIQKSIFLANLPVEVCNEIKGDLREVQAAYDNQDSIIIAPISTEYLRSMKVIGQNIDLDIVTRSKNTVFF